MGPQVSDNGPLDFYVRQSKALLLFEGLTVVQLLLSVGSFLEELNHRQGLSNLMLFHLRESLHRRVPTARRHHSWLP